MQRVVVHAKRSRNVIYPLTNVIYPHVVITPMWSLRPTILINARKYHNQNEIVLQ